MENIIKTYPNGLRLVVSPMPGFKSVSTNIYLMVGSRDELDDEHGLSHFVEHMMFKGTKTRSAEDISGTLDGLGVDVNAWTSNTATCYYTRGLASNVDTCVDILSDMYLNNQWSDEDFYKEADVIIQEIKMRDDDPRQAMFDLGRCTFFDGTPMGHEIAGTEESIRAMKPSHITNYIRKHYTAPKTIIGFSGDITVAQAEKLVEKYFNPNVGAHTVRPLIKDTKPETKLLPKKQFVTKKKDTEQHNVAMFFPVMNNVHQDRHAMSYVFGILADGMSSRLFSSVREKLGLVYTISGGLYHYDMAGYFYIWFSCTPGNTQKVLETIHSELVTFKRDGVKPEEIEKVRNTSMAGELYSAESVNQVNGKNVSNLSEYNKIKTTEEYLAEINAVTSDDVSRVANEYLKYDNLVIATVGKDIKFEPFKFLKQ